MALNLLIPVLSAAPPQVTLDFDWAEFLERTDMLWTWNTTDGTEPPISYWEAPFVGNGALGAMLWLNANGTLRFEISRTDVYDDREPGANYSVKPDNFVYNRPRLPIGHFVLAPPTTSGPIVAGALRLSLHDAELRGTLTGADGVATEVALLANAAVEAADVLVLRLGSSSGGGGSGGWHVSWVPSPADSTWAHNDPGYVRGLPVQQSDGVQPADGVHACVWPHWSGSAHALSWAADGGELSVSVSPVMRPAGAAADAAAAQVRAARTLGGIAGLRAAHRAWWRAQYELAWLTLAPAQMESFYWIQMYKLSSATRAGRAVHDLTGPWFYEGALSPGYLRAAVRE